jgi:hypothetical protein
MYKTVKPQIQKRVAMKIVNILIMTIVVLLSFAAGVAKLMQTPQEMEFLLGAGLSSSLIFKFGVVQVLGGILLLLPRTRIPGAILATAAFVVSAVLIFLGGNLQFAMISLLPVVLGCVIIYQCVKTPTAE